MFAIIETNGHQYEVKKGDIFLIDRMNKKEGATFKIPGVLFAGDDKGTAKIGKPKLKDVSVTAKVLEPEAKGEKLRVMKFKPRKRSKRVLGYRHKYTKIEITEIK